MHIQKSRAINSKLPELSEIFEKKHNLIPDNRLLAEKLFE